MPRRNDTIFDTLFILPWWVSVFVASIAYMALKYIIPSIQTEGILLKSLGKIGPDFAPFVALFFLLPAPFSLYEEKRKKKLVDSQTDIKSIRSM